ncbi:MAG: cobalamin-dependent protein [Bacilli bacterium]|nr:cobalamin-dependent protein [Bacilli bacterium]
MNYIKNILLINAPVYETYASAKYQPLGIGYIAACLEQSGYNCDLYDANCGVVKKINEIIEYIMNNDYDVIGLSCMTDSFKSCVEIATKIKEINKNIIIILGGHHATALHREIINEYECFDYIIRGEGEKTFQKLIVSLNKGAGVNKIKGISYRHTDKIFINDDADYIQELDVIPFPLRKKMENISKYTTYFDANSMKEKQTATIITSRGCIGKCTYCVDQDIYLKTIHKKWRCRSVENVTDELKTIFNLYPNVEHIIFFDACFLADFERAISILTELKRLKPGVTCSFTARADQIVRNKDNIFLLKQLGCTSIEIGIESGSDDCLQRFCKNTSVEINEQAIKILRDNNLLVQVDFIMFEPYMTIKDLKLNMSFLKKNGLYGHYPPLIYNRIILYPGSKIRKQMEQENLTFGNYNNCQYEHLDKKVNNCWKKMLIYMKECSKLNTYIVGLELKKFELIKKGSNINNNINSMVQLSKVLPYLYLEAVISEEESSIDQNSKKYIDLANKVFENMKEIYEI